MASSRFESACRRRLTPQQRQRLLSRFHQGQFTQREFAARAGIGLSTLVKWLQQERTQGQGPVRFQEVVMASPSGQWALEIVHPQGWTVRLARMSDAPSLPPLLSALPC